MCTGTDLLGPRAARRLELVLSYTIGVLLEDDRDEPLPPRLVHERQSTMIKDMTRALLIIVCH